MSRQVLSAEQNMFRDLIVSVRDLYKALDSYERWFEEQRISQGLNIPKGLLSYEGQLPEPLKSRIRRIDEHRKDVLVKLDSAIGAGFILLVNRYYPDRQDAQVHPNFALTVEVASDDLKALRQHFAYALLVIDETSKVYRHKDLIKVFMKDPAREDTFALAKSALAGGLSRFHRLSHDTPDVFNDLFTPTQQTDIDRFVTDR
ncbi:MAG TPA: hypothetical protein PKB15_00005 [Acidimicrobiia bacterium]|nr:hypothetical protein [Acidimicrobiia bacterium]